jgi:hypothetical protein
MPVCPQEFWACAAHSLSGSVLVAIGPQVPSAPEPFLVAVQAWQVPAHAEAQQTPSTQKVEAHSAPVPQAAPSTFGVWHVPPAQTKPDAQSPAPAHVVRHAPAEQLYGAQLVPLAEVPQVPVPLQTCGTTLEPWQIEEPHEVPDAKSWHAPAPSHWPVVPHVEAGCDAHSLSGSVPAAMGAHTPSEEPVLAAVHALHRPVHAVAQQTPSTQ